MESTTKSRSVGIAHFFKHISIAIWLNSLEYKFHGRDICPFLEKSTWNQPIPQSLKTIQARHFFQNGDFNFFQVATILSTGLLTVDPNPG